MSWAWSFSEPTPQNEDTPLLCRDDRRDEKGRFAAGPWKLRPVMWGQLGRRTPPTAVNANITEVLATFASEEMVPLPCIDEMRRMRGELTVASECLAAFRVALAKRIISFGFDESTKFGLGLLSSNTQIEPHVAPGTSVDVVMRGATLTAGGTSEEIAKSIDTKIFSHARRLLAGWKAEHEKKFKEGSWAADGGPSPESVRCSFPPSTHVHTPAVIFPFPFMSLPIMSRTHMPTAPHTHRCRQIRL